MVNDHRRRDCNVGCGGYRLLYLDFLTERLCVSEMILALFYIGAVGLILDCIAAAIQHWIAPEQ